MITINEIVKMKSQEMVRGEAWQECWLQVTHTTIKGCVNIGVIFNFIGNCQWCLYNIQSKSDWFSTHSVLLQGKIDSHWFFSFEVAQAKNSMALSISIDVISIFSEGTKIQLGIKMWFFRIFGSRMTIWNYFKTHITIIVGPWHSKMIDLVSAKVSTYL